MSSLQRACKSYLKEWNRIKRSGHKIISEPRRYRGISFRKDKGKWAAEFCLEGHRYKGGYHSTQEEAARAYDRIAVQHMGDMANLNFPVRINSSDELSLRLPPDPYASQPFSPLFVIFRHVPDFPGYGVDTNGVAWTSILSGRRDKFGEWRPLKPRWTGGYLEVVLFDPQSRPRKWHLHRLVTEVFLGKKPVGKNVCHGRSPDKSDNSIYNLRYDTQSANVMDSIRHGTRNIGTRHHEAKITPEIVLEIRRLRRSGWRCSDIAKMFGMSTSATSAVYLRVTWKHVVDREESTNYQGGSTF